MRGNINVVRGLKEKAEHDEKAALALFHLEITADIVCFHCQQAIEKYIKAVLVKQVLQQELVILGGKK